MYVVVYDGACNLCVTLVKVLEQWDRGRRFRYVPMQATETLQTWGITPAECELGMILLDEDQPQHRFQGSDAAEEIGRHLPFGDSFVQLYRSLPGAKSAGDEVYRFIRDHRYTLFGQRDRLYESMFSPCEGNRCAQSFANLQPSTDGMPQS